MEALVIAALALLAPCANAREQEYTVDLSDYALVASVKSLFDGEPLIDGLSDTPRLGLSSTAVMRMLKAHDCEFLIRARPAYRADGDKGKHSRGFYSVQVFLWEQFGPLAGLNYNVELFGGHGAATRIKSRIEIDVRRFGPRHGDRLILAVANIPIVHRLINRVAERAVHSAEFGLIHGFALADHARRDREREERRKSTGGPSE